MMYFKCFFSKCSLLSENENLQKIFSFHKSFSPYSLFFFTMLLCTMLLSINFPDKRVQSTSNTKANYWQNRYVTHSCDEKRGKLKDDLREKEKPKEKEREKGRERKRKERETQKKIELFSIVHWIKLKVK